MYEVKWTRRAARTYAELKAKAIAQRESRLKKKKKKSSKDEGLFKQVAKTIVFLQHSPRHPGLRTHKYESIQNPYNKKKNVFEAYVQNRTPGAYRVFWCFGPDTLQLTIIAITPHP